MRTTPDGHWRSFGLILLLCFLYVGCIALVTSCAPCGSNDAGCRRTSEKKEEKVDFWAKVESSRTGPGPIVHVGTEVLTLADGTKVVCVDSSTLWCKEVAGQKPAATQTSNRFETAPLRSSAPADLGGLDFGGSP